MFGLRLKKWLAWISPIFYIKSYNLSGQGDEKFEITKIKCEKVNNKQNQVITIIFYMFIM